MLQNLSNPMKVAKKSPKKLLTRKASDRATLTLPAGTYQAIDELREDVSRSKFVEELIAREKRRRDREAFVALVNSQCTESYRRETLKLMAETPNHGKG